MSHVVQIQTQVRDPQAVRLACDRLKLPTPVQRQVKLFSETVTGLAVELPQWRYPVVFDITTGQSRYDNYNGHWGNPQELDRLLQMYAVEKAKLEARKRGYAAREKLLADGSIQVVVQVAGGAA